MADIKIYKTQDLVLQVKKSYNPANLNLKKWISFIDALCGPREFQKEAIETAIIYLASKQYRSIEDLVNENWNNNFELRDRYKDLKEYEKKLPLPRKLSAVIDLATGTGKSYVIYGIAQIALGLELVDKVLVLCPSLTIESGLKEKFDSLSGDRKLKASLPEGIKYKNPRIIHANQTIKNGDICIENIHAVYEKTGSSINDSLKGAGERVLVLNDETHHVYNVTSDRDIRKWKEFLINTKFDFRYILGFTGTAYIDNEYFNDVIYRYSIRQAINDKVVKLVDYVSKDDTLGINEKFQKIYDNHLENINGYRLLKPITILVTKDISKAKILHEDLIGFLEKKEKLTKSEAEKKVLIVTSHRDHRGNIVKLKKVDDAESSVEWIISVSMLTEGWDVNNVFQIVPWEDRAFNSKLLIAQVLGRGLRIPPEYQSSQPKVRVFNHDAWSRNIRGLVDEVLEIEMRLLSEVLLEGQRSKYNFDIHWINYDKQPETKNAKKDTELFDYSKGYIDLVAQIEKDEKNTEYTDLYGNISQKNTLIEYITYSAKEVVDKIMEEFETRDWEAKILKLPGGEYKNVIPPREEVENIIKESLKRIGVKSGRISERNRTIILQAFGTLLRKKGKTVVNVRKINKPIKVSTKKIEKESIAVGNLRHGSTVFYTENFQNETNEETANNLNDFLDNEDRFVSASKEINPYSFKTPLSLVFTKGTPERKFVENLCKQKNCEKIDSWIKSRDQGFYDIEYSWRKGEHPTQNTFNPDFFIKVGNNIVIIEIKADGDDTEENRAKLRYGKEYVRDLNKELEKQGIKTKYYFHFLSPISFSEFFEYLSDGRLFKREFRSDIEKILI